MILTCPSCGTRYVVKDGAIPPEGRTVRCAQCKHSWHQEPEALVDGASVDEPVQQVPEGGQPNLGEAPASDYPTRDERGVAETDASSDHSHPDLSASSDPVDSDPLSGPTPTHQESAGALAEDTDAAEPEAATMPAEAVAASEPYPEEVVPVDAPEAEPVRATHPLRAGRVEADDLYSPFAEQEDEVAPRRKWPMVILAVLLVIAAVAAGIWFLAPAEVKNRLGLAQASGSVNLLLQVQNNSRQELASGNSLLEVSGTVSNPTEETVPVPAINAQLRNLDQKIVYKWTIPPPAPRLGPGGSASFNSANLNVPSEELCLEIMLAGDERRPGPCRKSETVGT